MFSKYSQFLYSLVTNSYTVCTLGLGPHFDWQWSGALSGSPQGILFIPVWLSLLRKQLCRSLQWLCMWTAGWEGSNLFKVSICTERFWIKQHLIDNLGSHGGPGEDSCAYKSMCSGHTPYLRFSCSYCMYTEGLILSSYNNRKIWGSSLLLE